MKKLILLTSLVVLACNSSQQTVNKTSSTASERTKTSPTTYASTILEDDLKEHLFIYASDEFEGRDTGSKGQKKAISYLKEQYEALGILPAKSDGNYFQKVPLEISKMPTGNITINNKAYAIGEDFVTFASLEHVTNEIVFAGFGIETDEYSDYDNIDVLDKIVLIEFGEPQKEDGKYLLSEDGYPSRWGDFNESLADRLQIATDKGAKAILIFEEEYFPRLKSRFEYISNNGREVMTLSSENSQEIPPIFIGENLGTVLKELITKETTTNKLKGNFEFNIVSGNKKIDSENVAAILKGSELPNEYVVISSHLDHIGVNADGQINNGADDDGSGTVALLEIAEAFKKASDDGLGPKRSIIFLHVTGEEKGLLGSRYYTDFEPIVPLENTVANLNIDMIGRIDPKRDGERNYIYLIGSDKLSTELHNLSEEINSKFTNIELDYKYNDENDPNRFYYRSDHYNFAKNNIPIIFYFNGTHEDYHRPGDTPDKINYDLLENRTRLIFHTAWEVANRENRVLVDKPSK
ncbi:M28 family peptidase [Croceivirga thetidis]|uniref:M28 family peptidase n=1 Tax=Croceivirga thetidis TaxID=2721623 RepID=A0ABX1GSV7_9FLAO|nr:M28 family peptidase [Croceivirga thetidis]NKI32091.1 M28 family peptidase [Croceivirga thetidis]